MCECTHGSGKHIINTANTPFNVVRLGSPMFYSIGLPFYFYYKQRIERLEWIMAMKKAAIIMGSDSDLPVVEKAFSVFEEFGVPYEVHVYSAHRTPAEAREFVTGARENGFGVIIAAAGKAAHLGGVIAAYTTLPVIGIPIKSSTMDGLDSLLSMVQMPGGIPVATVAIDGAQNAAILAAQMLALSDDDLADKLARFKDEMEAGVIAKDAKLQSELA